MLPRVAALACSLVLLFLVGATASSESEAGYRSKSALADATGQPSVEPVDVSDLDDKQRPDNLETSLLPGRVGVPAMRVMVAQTLRPQSIGCQKRQPLESPRARAPPPWRG